MELQETIDKINREWNEMKTVFEQGKVERKAHGDMLGETKARLEAIGAAIDALELKISRPGSGATGEKQVKSPAHTKAFGTYLRKGVESLQPDERKLLTVSSATGGGFAAPDEFDRDLIKGIVEISPARSLAKVRMTSQRSVKMSKRTGTFAAVWVAEVGTRAETTGYAIGLEELPVHEIYALVDVSMQDLEDVDFDLEGELYAEFAEQFAKAEGTAFVSGSGVGRPEGLTINAAIAESVTGHATDVTYAGFVEVSHNLKIGYMANARFLMNMNTLGKARQLVSGAGELMWAPMAAGAPATILGFPYTIVQDLANQGASAYPVFFGDFKRGYTLVDRIQTQVTRDDVTQATFGAVRYIARKRLGGQVVLAEAIRKLKCSV